jgi:ABC-type amino acid transport substrate-binding protein
VTASTRDRRGSRRAPGHGGHVRGRLLLAVLLAAVLCLAAAAGACGSSSGSSTESPSAAASPAASSAATVSLTSAERAYLAGKGTLTVGAFNDYPPYGFVDEKGAATGISVDYWNLLAQRLGVKVAFVPVLFADQLDGLKTGKFDSLQGIFPKPERKQWFAFSRPFYDVGTYMYVDAAHAGVTSADELKGLTVAVVDGDSGQILADQAGLKTMVVAGYPQAVKAVGSGKAQATIMDELPADYYIQQFGLSGKVAQAGQPLEHGTMTLPVQKDNTVLLGILNKGVASISPAEVQSIRDRWMGQ